MPEFTEKCVNCEYLGEGDKGRAICTADDCTEIDATTPDKPDLQQFTDPASLLSPEKFEKLRGQLADIPDSKTEFNPDYPATLDDAIEMIVGMFEEEVDKQTDETKGYKAGLLMGINILDTLKRISSHV